MQKASYLIRPVNEGEVPQLVEIDREAFPDEWLFRSYRAYKWDLKNPSAHYLVACTENNSTMPQSYAQRKESSKLSQQNRQQIPWFKRLFKPDNLIASITTSRNFDPASRLQEEEKITQLQKQDIIGFVGSWIMIKEAHIIIIAVRNSYRRMGIGEKLLISIIDLAAQLNTDVVTLEVRASNQTAQALYQKYGFQIIERRIGYYSDNKEDAIVMSTDSISSASFQSRFQELKQIHDQRWMEASVTT